MLPVRYALPFLTLTVMSCAQGPIAPGDAAPTTGLPAGPFAVPSMLAYELPDFRTIKDEDFLPGFEAGMALQRREASAIAQNAQAPGFDNTLVALERSGQMLSRVSRVFYNYTSSINDPAIEKVEKEMAPRLAAHRDAILLDAKLFSRIEALYGQRATLGLDAESLQLLEREHAEFVHAGARLSDADKAQLRVYNEQLATLSTRFRQTVLKATKDGAVTVTNAAELDGLSPEQIGAASSAAQARGLAGQWLLQLQNTTIQPPLANLKNRALRERIYRASINRGTGGDDDNTATIAQIVSIRARRAKLLGYPSHAAYTLEEEAARTPEAVNKMFTTVAPVALAAARREAADIQQLIDRQMATTQAGTFELQPWDWAYYAEQVRKAHYDFDESQVKPYFELDSVLKNGVFYAAHELYGITFTERTDLPVYEPSVRIFEVKDSGGSPLALFLADYFARNNKQGGAWSSSFVSQSKLLERKAVICNNLNIPRPRPGQAVLLTFDEVTTMFHEMGHALHAIFSAVKYPSLSGTNVPRDFVEYPSQFNEMWARDPKVLAHFARHFQSAEPMPNALFEKVLAAQKFGQGFASTEYLAAAMVDQSWHLIDAQQAPSAAQVMAFESRALQQGGLDYAAVPPRYHSPYFSHIFAGGYSASYYAYMWSEVLARDTGEWFYRHGGLTRANGDYLRDKVLSRGRTREPEASFEDFYGKPPEFGPLLEYRGLQPH